MLFRFVFSVSYAGAILGDGESQTATFLASHACSHALIMAKSFSSFPKEKLLFVIFRYLN